MTSGTNATPYVRLASDVAGRPSPGAAILKPCKSAVKPWLCAQGDRQPVEMPGTRTREAGLDSALVKDSVGTYRMDGQDRALLTPVAIACSNHPDQFRSAAGQRTDISHVTNCPEHTGLIFVTGGPVLLAARLSRPRPPCQGQAAGGRFASLDTAVSA